MLWVLLVLSSEATMAYVLLDLIFRAVRVDPDGLARRLKLAGLRYGACGAFMTAAGGWAAQAMQGVRGLLAVVAFGWIPWWLLWRFGLRKQFTHLYKTDGGQPVETNKPDP